MILYPAIDLLGGKVVRLRRGKRSDVDVYSDDPVAVARDFAACGATWIHVVDLSAAFEEDDEALAANARAIAGIAALPGIKVDTGGGVRSLERIDALAKLGVSRIALGTALVRDPDFARAAAAEFGNLLCADVAANDGRVAVNGWREEASMAANELVGELARMGFRHLVFTDIARDGTLSGPNLDRLRELRDATDAQIIASGGVRTLGDLRGCAALGLYGAICGKSLYAGTLSLAEALTLETEADV